MPLWYMLGWEQLHLRDCRILLYFDFSQQKNQSFNPLVQVNNSFSDNPSRLGFTFPRLVYIYFRSQCFYFLSTAKHMICDSFVFSFHISYAF